MIPRSPPPKRQQNEISSGTTDPSIQVQLPGANGDLITHENPERNMSQLHAEDNGLELFTANLPISQPGSSRTRSIRSVVELPQPIPTTIRGQSPGRLDPSKARIAFYDENIRTLIAEKDKAMKAAKEVEQSKVIALQEIRHAFDAEKQQWKDTTEMVCHCIFI